MAVGNGGLKRSLLRAANVLRAQTKPPGYEFSEIDVKYQDGYTKEFAPKALAIIKEFGCKFLAGGFNKSISLSGSRRPIV